jgi:hypothetical protein
MSGYQPVDGRRAKVRFAIRQGENRISTTGEGLVSDIDLENASRDSMAGFQIPFSPL